MTEPFGATTTWVYPGEYVSMVTESTTLLVSGAAFPIHKSRTADLWQLVESTAPITQVVDRLSGGAVGDAPDFGMARVEGDLVRVIVRGSVIARIGTQTVSAAGTMTWIEQVLPLTAPIVLSAGTPASGEPSGFVIEGIQRAHRIVRSPQPTSPTGLHPSAAPPPEPINTMPLVEIPDPGRTIVPLADEIPEIESAEAEAAGKAVDTPARVVDTETHDEAGYDHLFGATVSRTVEEAAVRPDEETASPAAPRPVASPADVDLPATPAVVAHEPTQAAPEQHTVRRGSKSVDADQAAPAHVPLGPTVQAVTCPLGHANPPLSTHCRVCTAPLSGLVAAAVPRPSLGAFAFSTGESVALVRPLVIGRSPKATSSIGGEMPLLFTVKSPQSDVSRSHLEVRIDGWHVLVVDLDTANGTVVELPGRPARHLHPGEPVTISVGTKVTLADEVSFVFEAEE